MAAGRLKFEARAFAGSKSVSTHGFQCTALIWNIQRVSECEWDCEVRSDVGNPRHRLWFFFRVTNAAARQRVVINVTGFSKVSLAVEQKPGCCSRVSYSRGFQHSEVGFDH